MRPRGNEQLLPVPSVAVTITDGGESQTGKWGWLASEGSFNRDKLCLNSSRHLYA